MSDEQTMNPAADDAVVATPAEETTTEAPTEAPSEEAAA